MGVMRTILGVALVVLLAVNLLAANAVVGADRTVLDAGFVKTTLEEEEAYGAAQSLVVERIDRRLEERDVPVPESIDVNRTVRRVLTRSYLENQTERNVNRVYDYLHGRNDTITLAVNTVPVKERLSLVVERRIRNMSVAEMIDFVSTQENMTVRVSGISIDLAVVGDMAENRSAYRSARQSLRKEVRRQVEETLPEDASESTVDAAVEETLASIAGAVEQQVETVVEGSLSEDFRPVTTAVADLVMVGVRGLTGEMPYATFEERLTDAKAELAENASTVVREQLDEAVEDRRVLLDDPEPPLRDRLELARRSVGILDLLAYVLPVVSIVLVGLLYLLTRSPSGTALGAGIAMVLGGGMSYAVASIAPGVVESRIDRMTLDVPPEAIDVALGVLDQVASAFGAQSLALLVLGGPLVVAGVALRFRDGEAGEPA